MKIVRKMCSMIRLEALGKGLVTGALVSALMNAFLLVSGQDVDTLTPVIMAVSFSVIGGVIAVLLSIRKTTALSVRFRSLERVSGSPDNDMIRMAASDLALGNRWLILKKGTAYKAWTADMLTDISLESSNPAATKGVLRLRTKDGREEKCIVGKSAALDAWIRNFKDNTAAD